MRKILFLLLLVNSIISAQEVLDKIAAVVNNEIILLSEVNWYTQVAAVQQNLNPDDPELKKQILNKMIEDKLLLAQAELDSIQVTDQEVEAQIESQISYLINQYGGSQERFEQAYGMSVERIKRKLREDTRKNLMAQRLKQQKFGKIEVTKREVEDFFTEYRDSLGQIPEKFEISHIFINPKAGEKVKQNAKEFAQTLLDSIKNGADFAELARTHSDDPGSKAVGGDLGFVKRGVFFPEFEAAAFKLNEGELSEVIESPVGFHIIQLLERRGESIHTRHILISVKIDDDADLRAIELLTEIRDSILNKVNTFEYFAKKYSDDESSAKFGGKLGTFEKGQLDKSMQDQVFKLKVGEISFPKRLEVGRGSYGFHIIRLDKRIEAHMPSLETDYEEIKRIAEFKKSEDLFNEWLGDVKEKIYWEIKI
ncbi:MAG: peptidylprolyl isomerase [Melioribacteraceae bacterium]|nr:peptidylprolyl isomerase [Melioribacteraceae bacterium]MDD3558157.1 peptidylprolyl isomerase [Melioribacteraceae bacterium]